MSSLSQVGTSDEIDAGIAAAVQQAQDALNTSLVGIKTIMEALGAGELSPAFAWSQVDNGLNVANAALDSITSSSEAVNDVFTVVQDHIASTREATKAVAKTCN